MSLSNKCVTVPIYVGVWSTQYSNSDTVPIYVGVWSTQEEGTGKNSNSGQDKIQKDYVRLVEVKNLIE